MPSWGVSGRLNAPRPLSVLTHFRANFRAIHAGKPAIRESGGSDAAARCEADISLT
jgi:hypothetical protein